MWGKQNRGGFTIVELLIVIVIIAILAAITIVAYNGIQQRARETKLITGVNSYIKALTQYKAINGDHPTDNGCLGSGYINNACWYDGSSVSLYASTPLDNSLSPFMPTKYEFGPDRLSIGIGNHNRGGLAYFYNDATHGNRLVYYLSGINRSCGVGGRVTPNNEGGVVTQCNITLP